MHLSHLKSLILVSSYPWYSYWKSTAMQVLPDYVGDNNSLKMWIWSFFQDCQQLFVFVARILKLVIKASPVCFSRLDSETSVNKSWIRAQPTSNLYISVFLIDLFSYLNCRCIEEKASEFPMRVEFTPLSFLATRDAVLKVENILQNFDSSLPRVGEITDSAVWKTEMGHSNKLNKS